MATPKLFQYAVIFNPVATKEQADRGEKPKSEVIVPITGILALDANEAMMHVARAIPKEFENKLDRVEIALRPF